MDVEIQILNNIEKNNKATQRDIAKSTGMSLGNVNLLIKRLVKKGFLKVERLTPRTIRYILTPKGLAEKTKATYRYVLSSYQFINEINSKMDCFMTDTVLNEKEKIILFGKKDEICEILNSKLNNRNISFNLIRELEELKNILHAVDQPKPLILIWQPEYAELCVNNDIQFIDILKQLN